MSREIKFRAWDSFAKKFKYGRRVVDHYTNWEQSTGLGSSIGIFQTIFLLGLMVLKNIMENYLKLSATSMKIQSYWRRENEPLRNRIRISGYGV